MDNRKYTWSLILLIVVYAVGITGYVLPSWRESIVAATPLNILFCTGLLFFNSSQINPKLGGWALLTAAGGWLIEVVGVRTQLVFGSYYYGVTLGPGVLGVPFMMAVNWLMLAYAAAMLAQMVSTKAWVRSLVGAAVMVGYDIVLEPIAMKFDLWQWKNDQIPLQNYVAWFVFGWAFQWLFTRWGGKTKNKLVIGVFAIQLVFFAIVLVTH